MRRRFFVEANIVLRRFTVAAAELVRLAVERVQATGAESADAYIAAAMTANGCDAIATFNRRDFKKRDVVLAEF